MTSELHNAVAFAAAIAIAIVIGVAVGAVAHYV